MRSQPHGRFVEKHEQFRLGHDGAANGQHLLFAAGQASRQTGFFRSSRAGKAFEDLLQIFGDSFFVISLVGAEFQIFYGRVIFCRICRPSGTRDYAFH